VVPKEVKPVTRKSLLNLNKSPEGNAGKKVTRSTKELPKTTGVTTMSINKMPTHKRTMSQSTQAKKPATIVNTVNTQSYVNINISNEEKVINCLKDSLKLFERIQKDFEQSAVDNRDKENDIKNILKTIVITDYPYISDFEKRLITDQIAESSDQRVKNYENLFSIINTSIRDLRKFFIGYFKGKTLVTTRYG
jgi:hypothetical protein